MKEGGEGKGGGEGGKDGDGDGEERVCGRCSREVRGCLKCKNCEEYFCADCQGLF